MTRQKFSFCRELLPPGGKLYLAEQEQTERDEGAKGKRHAAMQASLQMLLPLMRSPFLRVKSVGKARGAGAYPIPEPLQGEHLRFDEDDPDNGRHLQNATKQLIYRLKSLHQGFASRPTVPEIRRWIPTFQVERLFYTCSPFLRLLPHVKVPVCKARSGCLGFVLAS